ncbi:MAG: hypothetical protein ABEN55_04005 [Bradymonadaceae bacterium]
MSDFSMTFLAVSVLCSFFLGAWICSKLHPMVYRLSSSELELVELFRCIEPDSVILINADQAVWEETMQNAASLYQEGKYAESIGRSLWAQEYAKHAPDTDAWDRRQSWSIKCMIEAFKKIT